MNPRPSCQEECSATQPIFRLPPATRILIFILIVVHIIRVLMPQMIDSWVVWGLAFIPARTASVDELTRGLFLLTSLTYAFLHADFPHLIFNVMGMAAFVTPIETMMGAWRMLILSALSAVAGAVVHALFYPSSDIPLVGASSAISGCLGALLCSPYIVAQLNAGKRSLFLLCGVWIGFQLLLALLQESDSWQGESVAWAAHIGGFLTGVLFYRICVHGSPRLFS